MRTQAPSSQPASDDVPGAASDFARPALEEQLAGLARLARMGLRIVEGLERLVDRAEAAIAGDAPAAAAPEVPAIALAYARASKAVRLTYALQSKVIEDLRRVGRIEGAEAAEAERHREAQVRARKDKVAAVVTRIIEDDAEDDETYERLVGEATERLCDRESFGDVLNRPISDLIAQICGDLGLDPDWGSLSGEAWAQAEMRSGVIGDALASLLKPPTSPRDRRKSKSPPVQEAFSSPAGGGGGAARSTVTEGALLKPSRPLHRLRRSPSPASGGGENIKGPPPEPSPSPIPVLSPIRGERVEKAGPEPAVSTQVERAGPLRQNDKRWKEPPPPEPPPPQPWRPAPHEGPHVLPGELPPPRRPRPSRAWA